MIIEKLEKTIDSEFESLKQLADEHQKLSSDILSAVDKIMYTIWLKDEIKKNTPSETCEI